MAKPKKDKGKGKKRKDKQRKRAQQRKDAKKAKKPKKAQEPALEERAAPAEAATSGAEQRKVAVTTTSSAGSAARSDKTPKKIDSDDAVPASNAVRAEWARRVEAEYRSAAITQHLTLWLIQMGASPDLIPPSTARLGPVDRAVALARAH